MTGSRRDDGDDLEKLGRMRHFPANVGSRDLEGAGVVPPLLVVCPPPDSWGQTIIKEWYSNFGMTMDLVEDYDLIPREDLPRYRLVLFHVYPFFDARTGSCFSREMLRNMQVGSVTEPQVPLLENGNEHCAGMIRRLHAARPSSALVVTHVGARHCDELYYRAGAKFVFRLDPLSFADSGLPRFLMRLLEQSLP